MSELKHKVQLLEVRRLMRYQFVVLISIIFLGAAIYGIQTNRWFTAVKLSATLLLCVTLFAPVVYNRAKHRMEAFNTFR